MLNLFQDQVQIFVKFFLEKKKGSWDLQIKSDDKKELRLWIKPENKPRTSAAGTHPPVFDLSAGRPL